MFVLFSHTKQNNFCHIVSWGKSSLDFEIDFVVFLGAVCFKARAGADFETPSAYISTLTVFQAVKTSNSNQS